MAIQTGLHPNRNFAEFAETLSFVKTGQSHSPSRTKSSQSDDEQKSLLSNFISWGSTASTAPPSSVPSQFSSKNPSIIGSPSPQSGFTSFTQYAKQGFSAVRNSTNFAVSRTQERVEEVQSSMTRYLYFTLSSLVGAFLISLSFLFLPMIVFAPQKFSLLFTLGSLFLINGLGLLKGYRSLFNHLIQQDRAIFSAGYFTSVLLTLYGTLYLRSYLLTLIFAGSQLMFLASLLISYVANGSAVFSSIKGIGVSMARNIFGGGNNPILPL